MKPLIIFATALLLHLSQGATIAQQPSVSLENVQPEYKNLAEVKPILLNAEDKSIYLLPKECGEVLVSFLHDEYWWDSDLKDCPEVAEPIEIMPGEIYHIPSLVIRFEQGEGKFFEEKHGKPGKHKITISYSFNPTYRDGKPEIKRLTFREFSIVK